MNELRDWWRDNPFQLIVAVIAVIVFPLFGLALAVIALIEEIS